MKNLPAFFLSLLLFFSIANAQQQKQRIAVLELEADGVSKNESVTLTNRLRSELVKTGSFIIIERGEMDEILKEQGFQLSGCTSDECVVEAGRLLNVRQIAAGSIGKVGALYTVAVRLIDVQSGEILKTVTEDCQCPIERVLTNSMRNAALKLSGRMGSGTGVAVLGEGSGDIYIKTSPSGADIYLDNIQTGKISPVTLQDVAAGKHFIKVVKGKFIGTKSVTVKANDIAVETITLESAKGGFKVYSTPPEAEIFIDGQSYGKTPKVIEQLSTGEHQLILKMKQYENFIKTVNVNFNQFSKINANMKELGNIRIQSNPTDANIIIDGKVYGRTPKTLHTFLSGKHSISIRKEGYVEHKSEIKVEAEKTTIVNAKLKKFAEIYLYSEPSTANVYLNGVNKGKTPLTLKLEPDKQIQIKLTKDFYTDWEKTIDLEEGTNERVGARLEKQRGNITLSRITKGATLRINGKEFKTDKKELSLPVGEYTLDISKPGFVSKSLSLDINSGKTITINESLKEKTISTALFRSLFIPGLGQSYQEKGTRSWIYSAAFIGSGIGSYFYTNKYNTTIDEYDEIRNSYLAASNDNEINTLRDQMDSKFDDIGSSEDIRNIFYITTGAIWLVNMFDVLILPSGWQKSVSVSSNISKDTFKAGLSLKLN